MLYQRQIIAYHGCLKDRFEAALLDGVTPPFSEEDYDWLGKGVYFWEHGPERALAWARDKARREGVDPSEARVLGAIIQLGTCLDLLDIQATEKLSKAFETLDQGVRDMGRTLPRNGPSDGAGDILLRYLDRAIIEFAIDDMSAATSTIVQTVRGAFWEGGPAFPGSVVQKKSHIQVAVRDTDCIVGYFKPRILEQRGYDA